MTLEEIVRACAESQLRTAHHNEAKAQAERQQAEIMLEHTRRALASLDLPAVKVGGGASS